MHPGAISIQCQAEVGTRVEIPEAQVLAIYSPSYKCRRKVEWSIESKRGTKVCPYVKNISVCKQEKKSGQQKKGKKAVVGC